MVPEELIQFIWRSGLLVRQDLRSTCGRPLEVLTPGEQNFHSGPDFFAARIRIGRLVWAGNVEVHSRGSDWERHGHHLDPAYNNVILHVISDDDRPALNSLGRKIPTLRMDCPPALISYYRSLMKNDAWLPCQSQIRQVPRTWIRHWLSCLMAERLEHKGLQITRLLHRNRGNWEAALCFALGEGFGLPVNRLPFELTLSGIPYSLLMQSRDNREDLEGILFGQAGFLSSEHGSGPYFSDLCQRYRQFRSHLQARPVDRHLWKFLRLRPASFPTIRLSQYASLLHLRFPLLELLLECTSLQQVAQLIRVPAGEYWNTHYLFGKCSPDAVKWLGAQSVSMLILNVLVPFLFTYGRQRGHYRAFSQASAWLQEAESESNWIITAWAESGIVPDGAFESQALIHLYKAYCKQKRCLDCHIGAALLRHAAHEKK